MPRAATEEPPPNLPSSAMTVCASAELSACEIRALLAPPTITAAVVQTTRERRLSGLDTLQEGATRARCSEAAHRPKRKLIKN